MYQQHIKMDPANILHHPIGNSELNLSPLALHTITSLEFDMLDAIL